jgi:nitroreductase
MTMTATSQGARGESVPQPRQSAVTDQGGLVAALTVRPASSAADRAAASARPRPGGAFTSADIATVVAIAGRAPSVHNTQPWRFRITGDVIELRGDPDRILTQIDPAGRELMISCGAALFGVRLGLRQLGCVPAVQLFPDPAQPWLVARAWPDAHAALNSVEAELIAAVPHRHTHRGPFTPGEVSPRLLAALAVDAAAEGSELRFIEEPGLVSDLAALVDRAAAQQQASAEIVAETRDWVRPTGTQARDGVPARAARSALGAGGARDAGAQRFRQRDFGVAGGGSGAAAGAGEDAGEPPAVTAVLFTAGDNADDWLCAGQALNRLLLRAATRWVFASLQSQPMESALYRQQVRELLATQGQPQMLLQFGRANTAPATPRRPQSEFRTNENEA